jgi:hypothetical protein
VKVRKPIDAVEWAGRASGVLVEEFAESLAERRDQRAERIADALFRLRDHASGIGTTARADGGVSSVPSPVGREREAAYLFMGSRKVHCLATEGGSQGYMASIPPPSQTRKTPIAHERDLAPVQARVCSPPAHRGVLDDIGGITRRIKRRSKQMMNWLPLPPAPSPYDASGGPGAGFLCTFGGGM